MKNLAPITLFVYNRPEHTLQTLEALKGCELAQDSTLIVYSDGNKSEKDSTAVNEVRKILKKINGFKSVTIIEKEKNFGLARSIIEGVTETINKFQRIIVLEDDILCSKYFLRYMNASLEFYQTSEKVMHISGYQYPLKPSGLPETFFLRPTTCWGWGTWQRAWQFYERNPEKAFKALSAKEKKEFNLNNSYDFWSQIVLNYRGRINSWAIFWYLTVFLHKGLCLHPAVSLTKNTGFDGSGTYCDPGSMAFNVSLSNFQSTHFEKNLEINEEAAQRLEYFLKRASPSIRQRIKNKINNLFKK